MGTGNLEDLIFVNLDIVGLHFRDYLFTCWACVNVSCTIVVEYRHLILFYCVITSSPALAGARLEHGCGLAADYVHGPQPLSIVH